MANLVQMMIELKAEIESLMPDAQKAEEKGNLAANTRITKGMMSVKNKAQAIRELAFSLR